MSQERRDGILFGQNAALGVKMAKRIHVVGMSPRSGTTLMVELLVASYEIDGHSEHEMSIFERPDVKNGVFCSKNSPDLLVIRPMLWIDPNLWVINMVRDPRDVIVSRHKRDPSNRYYAPLRVWKDRRRAARKVSRHPRVLTVRYEDLVADPGKVQQEIEDRIPFLRRKADFVDFHKTATPSDLATKALGGIRAISTSSIGNWRQHKSRLVGQLAKFGPIDEDLVFYGYERDDSWQRELDGVMADNTPSTLRDRFSLKERILRPPRRAKRILRYWISVLCEADG